MNKQSQPKLLDGALRAQLLKREGVVKDVPLEKIRFVTREDGGKINEARVNYLVSAFDFDKLGTPVVNERNGWFYLIDGNHRVTALIRIYGIQKADTISCLVYTDLTEEEEAEKFLSLADVLAISAFAKFQKAVKAGRADESHIYAVVQGAGLRISREPGSIACVQTLVNVYRRSSGNILGRTLRIIRDAYGDSGFEARVIDGIGYLCQRYDGSLNEAKTIECLAAARGGLNGLLGKAEILHKQTGNPKSQCVAAAAVDIINAKHGGKKLPSWWKVA